MWPSGLRRCRGSRDLNTQTPTWILCGLPETQGMEARRKTFRQTPPRAVFGWLLRLFLEAPERPWTTSSALIVILFLFHVYVSSVFVPVLPEAYFSVDRLFMKYCKASFVPHQLRNEPESCFNVSKQIRGFGEFILHCPTNLLYTVTGMLQNSFHNNKCLCLFGFFSCSDLLFVDSLVTHSWFNRFYWIPWFPKFSQQDSDVILCYCRLSKYSSST